jgi:Ca2+-transporting ATPase
MRGFWTRTSEEVAQLFKTDLKRGLSPAEVDRRRREDGWNELPKPKPVSNLFLFCRQFSSPLIWLLIGAALIAFFLGEWTEMQAILAIVLLNACVGFYQEYRAGRAFESLKNLLIPRSKVIREESVREIPSREIVPGDLILLEAGDRVPADGRLIYSAQFAVQEAALTGESASVHKKIGQIEGEALPLADRKNCVFLGTEVVSGKGIFIATATGCKTELGKIAAFLQVEKKETTPLQMRLDRLCRYLIVFCASIVALLFPLGLFRGESWVSMLLTALSLAVAAIPEGLPAIVTITLAIGVQKMARRNALIRRLSSVETLGCASVICSDKTGTITQNEMVVRKIWTAGVTFDVGGFGYEPKGEFAIDGKHVDPKDFPDLLFALQIGSLCNQAELIQCPAGWKIQGDPTEGALLVAAAKANLWKEALEEEHPFLGELPFDSERRRMSVLRKGSRLYVKGAPDVILHLSKKAPAHQEIENQIERFAQSGLRVLGVAYRDLEEEELSFPSESNLVFVGLIGMIDPPRPGVREAIEMCVHAHIRPIMITGDHKKTAIAVAQEVGLISPNAQALEGKEIDMLDDAALQKAVMHTSVYARVSAEHKLRIIKALKRENQVVAMTGDGVNDAPAIAQADIGIAMGITGTDVTKEASDMVLMDDHFKTIVNAVEEGRTIYENIIKFVFLLMSVNLGELFAIFFGILLGFEGQGRSYWVILLPVQILWINLVSESFPAIALAFDPPDPKSMHRRPRSHTAPILPLRRMVQLVAVGIVVAAATLLAAHYGFAQGKEHGQTMAFTSLVILNMGNVILIHLPLSLQSNPKLIGAILFTFALQLLVIYFPPLQTAFSTTALTLADWGILAALFIPSMAINWAILRWKY